MKVAVLGLGNVGCGIYKILKERKTQIEKHIGKEIEIAKILVRDINKKRLIDIDRGLLTDSFKEILEDPEIWAVIEVTSSKNQSIGYIKEALKNGKDVVTANKAALAAAYDDIVGLANDKGRALLFEAAVAGGLPIISPIRKRLAFEEFDFFQGIVNGSSNYLLTELTAGKDKDRVLQEASKIGVLEEDPTDDLSGNDALRKLTIIVDLFLAGGVKTDHIPCMGIERIESGDLNILKNMGRTVKLIAQFKKLEGHEYEASVMPRALVDDHVLSRVGGIYNKVIIKGGYADNLSFFGKGGGMAPTADAVVSDLIELAENKSSKLPLDEMNYKNTVLNEKGKYYIRLEESQGHFDDLALGQALELYAKGACLIRVEE